MNTWNKWNFTANNILEKKKLNLSWQNEDKNFQLFISSIYFNYFNFQTIYLTEEIWLQKLRSFLIMKIYYFLHIFF